MAIKEHKYYLAICDECGHPLRTYFNNGPSMLDGESHYYPVGMKDEKELLEIVKKRQWTVTDGKFKCSVCNGNHKPKPGQYGLRVDNEHNSPVMVENETQIP